MTFIRMLNFVIEIIINLAVENILLSLHLSLVLCSSYNLTVSRSPSFFPFVLSQIREESNAVPPGSPPPPRGPAPQLHLHDTSVVHPNPCGMALQDHQQPATGELAFSQYDLIELVSDHNDRCANCSRSYSITFLISFTFSDTLFGKYARKAEKYRYCSICEHCRSVHYVSPYSSEADKLRIAL